MTALGGATSLPAMGQIVGARAAPAVDTVAGRTRPGYAAVGIPIGAFRLYPSFETRASYDTNIYALPNAPADDAALLLVPRLALTSIENRRYAVALVVDGTVTRYARRTIENNAAYGAVASGRIEVDRDTQLTTSVTLARRIQRRGTEDEAVIGILPPVAFRELAGTVSVERRFGPVVTEVGGSVSQFRYEAARINGARVMLSDNDFGQSGANGRVALALAPALGAFAAASFNNARYAASMRVPRRDSSGYALLGGVALVTPLVGGEIGVGYLQQSFQSPAYRDIRGFNYAVKANWSATTLVDVHLDIGRSVQRSALLGAAGIRLDRATVSADYELLRNLLLDVGLAYTASDYRGLDRRERRLDAVFGARYLANANVSLVASLAATAQQRASGSASGRDYDRVRVSIGARVQL